MLFNVEVDTGDLIVGYVVLDSFNGEAEVIVSRRGEDLLRVSAIGHKAELKQTGRHETGNCGFLISEAELPGLGAMTELEIREPESGLIIYRRCPDEYLVPRKIFRLETQLLPLVRLDRSLQPHFQFYFPLIDRFGLETSNQAFLMNRASCYISGRVAFRTVEYYLDQGYGTIALVQDPFEELAERILVMRLIAQGYKSFLGMRDAVVFEDAVGFAESLDIESVRDLKRSFRDLPQSVSLVLGDPLVRQLTTRLPDENITTSSIGLALNVLSTFEIVGIRERSGQFVEAVADRFSLDPDGLPGIDPIPATAALADRLRACPPVQFLLENDVAVYEHVKDAFEKPGKPV